VLADSPPPAGLSAGCGCGVPVARSLADAGFRVVGIDISERQVERARRLVPQATFIQAGTSIESIGTGSIPSPE
jgi:2-polyprenyl-3-methyl-5-hydroxy-6-metoxy-1,4-benzoquinol methylase